METLKTLFDVYEGQKTENQIVNPTSVGSATLYDGNKYYVIRITARPFKNYFLVKNQNAANTYLIFARRWRTADQVFFKHPVGHGLLSSELKEAVELKFRFLNQSLFMSLFPRTNQGGFIDAK